MEYWCEKHKTLVTDFCDRCLMEKTQAEFTRRLDAASPFSHAGRTAIAQPKCDCRGVHTCNQIT